MASDSDLLIGNVVKIATNCFKIYNIVLRKTKTFLSCFKMLLNWFKVVEKYFISTRNYSEKCNFFDIIKIV